MKILVTILVILTSLPLMARGNGTCRKEITEFCGEHRGDRQAMRQCIEANFDQLSEECQTKRNKGQERKRYRRQEGNQKAD